MPPGIRCGWTQDVRIFTHLGEKCVNLQPDRQTLRADYCTLGDAVWLWLVRLLRTLARSRCFASRLSVPRGFCSGRRRCNINPSRNIAMSLPTTWVASAWRGVALLLSGARHGHRRSQLPDAATKRARRSAEPWWWWVVDHVPFGLPSLRALMRDAAGQAPRSRRASTDCMSRRPSTIKRMTTWLPRTR